MKFICGVILLLIFAFVWLTNSHHTDRIAKLSKQLDKQESRHAELYQHVDYDMLPKVKQQEESVDKLHEYCNHCIEQDRKTSDRLDKLEKAITEATAILSIISSENFAAIQAGKPEDIIQMSIRLNLLKIRINRMPKYLPLTENQKRWLERYIDK